jgi:hypothetical protein
LLRVSDDVYSFEELIKRDTILLIDIKLVEDRFCFVLVGTAIEDLFHKALPFVELNAKAVIDIYADEAGKYRLSFLKPILYHQLRSLPLVTTE